MLDYVINGDTIFYSGNYKGGFVQDHGCKIMNLYGVKWNHCTVHQAFAGNKSVEEIIFPKNGFPKAKSLDYAFAGCENLKRVELPLEIPNLHSMDHAFERCKSLRYVSVPYFKNLRYMTACFRDCRVLISVWIGKCRSRNYPEHVDPMSIYRADDAFMDCWRLSDLHIHNMTFENAIDLSWMFRDCKALKHANKEFEEKLEIDPYCDTTDMTYGTEFLQ